MICCFLILTLIPAKYKAAAAQWLLSYFIRRHKITLILWMSFLIGMTTGSGFANQNCIFAYSHAQITRPLIGGIVALVMASPDSVTVLHKALIFKLIFRSSMPLFSYILKTFSRTQGGQFTDTHSHQYAVQCTAAPATICLVFNKCSSDMWNMYIYIFSFLYISSPYMFMWIWGCEMQQLNMRQMVILWLRWVKACERNADCQTRWNITCCWIHVLDYYITKKNSVGSDWIATLHLTVPWHNCTACYFLYFEVFNEILLYLICIFSNQTAKSFGLSH